MFTAESLKLAHLEGVGKMAVMILQVSVLLSVLLLCVKGQIVKDGGECPSNVKGQADFDITRFAGVWYDTLKYWTVLDLTITCTSSNFTLLPDDKLAFAKSFKTLGMDAEMEGVVEYNRSDPTLFHIYDLSRIFKFTLNVLFTDYGDFAILWACQPGLVIFHTEYLWVVTRERVASEVTINRAQAKIVELGMDPKQLILVEQRLCEDDPETGYRSLLGQQENGLIFKV